MTRRHIQKLLFIGQPLEWRELPLKQFDDDTVELQITHCGICGSDIHTLDSGKLDARDASTASMFCYLTHLHFVRLGSHRLPMRCRSRGKFNRPQAFVDGF